LSKRKNGDPTRNIAPAIRKPRVLLWDIETDGLQADRIVCIGYKFLGEREVHMLKATDYPRDGLWCDKGLIDAFVKVFEECDYHVTWYGSRFDEPVLKTRMIAHEMLPLMPKPHVDLWKAVRYRFRLYSNRLQAWQDHLGLREDKTPVKPSVWIKARYGDAKALEYIYEHCHFDVLVLEKAFKRVRPWIDTEPARGLITGDHHGCPTCGHKKVQRRGYKVANTRAFQQFRCMNPKCGRWFRARVPAKISEIRPAA